MNVTYPPDDKNTQTHTHTHTHLCARQTDPNLNLKSGDGKTNNFASLG